MWACPSTETWNPKFWCTAFSDPVARQEAKFLFKGGEYEEALHVGWSSSGRSCCFDTGQGQSARSPRVFVRTCTLAAHSEDSGAGGCRPDRSLHGLSQTAAADFRWL